MYNSNQSDNPIRTRASDMQGIRKRKEEKEKKMK